MFFDHGTELYHAFKAALLGDDGDLIIFFEETDCFFYS